MKTFVMPLSVVVVTAAVTGCGLGLHSNGTVSRTLPYHASVSDLRGYVQLDDAAPPARTLATSVVVSPFAPYYAKPAVLAVQIASSSRWAVIDGVPSPEAELTRLFASALPGSGAPGARISGVVTAFEWYVLAESGEKTTGAGRVSSIVTVTDASGHVVFDAEHTTTGRTAADPAALYKAHVRAWLENPRLVQALSQAGGKS